MLEKLCKGMYVLICEGIVFKDFYVLVSLLNINMLNVMGFCIDDWNLLDIVEEGYFDYFICIVIELGIVLVDVYWVVIWFVVCVFGLRDWGLVVSGKCVDLVLLLDYK